MKGSLLWISWRPPITQFSRLIPRHFRALSSSETGSSSSSSSSFAHKDESVDSTEERFQNLTESIKSDAFFSMLASPLRRCAVTQITLPKMLMFQLSSQRPCQETPMYRSLIASEIERLQKEPNSLLRRRSRRWVEREAKKSKHKRLLQSQRLLLHKVVTSQTDESRQRFSDQVSTVKNQLASLLQPPPRGQLLPYGLTKDVIRKMKDISKGKGVWCTLNQKIIKELTKRGIHRLLPATNPSPNNLSELIRKELEERVLEEIRLLKNRLKASPAAEIANSGWLIRRLRGPEVRSILFSSHISLHYGGDESSVACLILSSGKIEKMKEGKEVYDLKVLFSDEKGELEFRSAMQEIATLIHKKAKKVKPKITMAKGDAAFMDEKSRVTKEEPTTSKPTEHDGQKYPRLHVIKRNERTVDLCIALWRLHCWCTSAS